MRPTRFGNSAQRIVQIMLDGGPITVSSSQLRVSKPTLDGSALTYSSVATDTDLVYSVSPAAVDEKLILKSAKAPTTFSFHIADPTGQLGQVRPATDGGYVFTDPIADDERLALPPAVAYEQPVGDAPAAVASSSAHLSVVAAKGGFDVTISVDPTWLAGKSFPVVLDPTWDYGYYYTSSTQSGLRDFDDTWWNPNSPDYSCYGGGCGSTGTDANLPIGTGQYPNTSDYYVHRVLLYYDTSGIPTTTQISAAAIHLTSYQCDSVPPLGCPQPQQNIDLHQMTTSNWSSYNSFTTLSGSPASSNWGETNPTVVNTQTWNGCYCNTTLTFPIQALAQGWVSNPSTNYGVSLNDQVESYLDGGPFAYSTYWGYTTATNYPYLEITGIYPPRAPQSPNAYATSSSSAHVYWSAPADNGGATVTNYEVWTYNANGTIDNNIAEPQYTNSSNTYLDIGGLATYSPYYFYVVADNQVGWGDWSQPTPTIQTYPNPPGPPTAVSLSAGVRAATAYWSPSTSNGGEGPDSYTATLEYSNGSQVTGISNNPATVSPCGAIGSTCQMSASWSGLANGTTYQVAVVANNSSGTPSGVVTAQATTIGLPGTPTSLTVSPGVGQISASWSPSSTSGGEGPDSYTASITQGGNPVSGQNPVTDSPCGGVGSSCRMSASWSGLANTTTYQVCVVANNSAGSSTAVCSTSTTPATVPGTPAFSGVTPGIGQLAATWTAPSSNGGAAITGYTLYATDPSTGAQAGTGTTCNCTSGSVTGLANNKAYNLWVYATNSVGNGNPAETQGTTDNVPGPPTQLSATPGPESVTATWAAPTSNGGAAVTSYTIYATDPSTGATVGQASPPCNCLSGSVSGLGDNTTYDIWVYATNGAGNGTPAEVQAATPIVAPGPPAGVSASPGNAQATVTITPPSKNGGSFITEYDVTPHDVTTSSVGPAQAFRCGTPSAPTNCTQNDPIPGLINGHEYFFSVTATNSAGPGGATNSNTVTLDAPPTVTKTLGTIGSGGTVSCPSGGGGTVPTVNAGDEVAFCVGVSESWLNDTVSVNVTDTVPAGLQVLSSGGVAYPGGGFCGPPTCTVSGGNTVTISGLSFGPSTGTQTFVIRTVASGLGAGCATLSNQASATNPYGSTSASQSVTTCDAGLGLEPWWTYSHQALGPSADGYWNAGDGNLVVTATDTPTIGGRGHLAFSLGRAYNSRDNVVATLPGSLGAGWLLNLAQTDDLAGAGVVADGLYVPSTEAVANPLAVTVIDREGTRQVFALKGAAVPGIANMAAINLSSSSTSAALKAAVGSIRLGLPTGYNTLCVDATYSPPPGVHMTLWRYVAISSVSSSSPCTDYSSAASPPLVLGFGAERADRLHYEFSVTGNLVAMRDQAGNEMDYAYGATTTNYGQISSVAALGPLRQVYETNGGNAAGVCGPTGVGIQSLPGTCRAYTLSYSTDTATTCPAYSYAYAVCVKDPAGRTTQYFGDASFTTTGHLVAVYDPDNPLGASGSPLNRPSEAYTYGSCPGASPNQLCSVTDPNGAKTTFSYSAAPAGLPRLASLTNRGGNATNAHDPGHTVGLSYNDSSQYVTADAGPPGVACAGNAGCERTRYVTTVPGSSPAVADPYGRIAEVDAGDASGPAGNFLRQGFYFWDFPNAPAPAASTTCRVPDQVMDNDLCRQVTRAQPSSSPQARTGAAATGDHDTSYTYNAEGEALRASQVPSPGASPLVSTDGYHAQYFEATGSVTTFDDSVAGNGSVTSAGPASGRADPNTLYYLSDHTASLGPRGNDSANSSSYTGYLATYHPDYPAGSTMVAPNQAFNVGTLICGNGPNATANTGLLCQSDAPAKDGTNASSTAYSYDYAGERSTMYTPDEIRAIAGGGSPQPYRYFYWTDQENDLSNTVSAGGWLQAVEDPAGHYVEFAYDRAGNVARTWDRNATAKTTAQPTDTTWDSTSSPPSGAYTEVLHGPYPNAPAGSSAYSAPWRYVVSSRDQLGDLASYTLDANGNRLSIRPPRGNKAANSSYDTTQSFGPDDLLTSQLLPAETSSGAATSYSYDAFGNRAATTDPKGQVTADVYDSVNRNIAHDFTRGPWPTDTTTVPPACHDSGAPGDPAAIPTGRILCSTTTTYDGTDAKVATQDGNHHSTTYTYDGLGRVTNRYVPRNDGTLTTLRTATVYDDDGNVTDSCPPREFAAGGSGTCSSTAAFSTHHAYNHAGEQTSTTTYRSAGGAALTSTSSYDSDGNVLSATDANGHTTTYTYDLVDRQATKTVPRDVSTTYTTHYYYDPAGNRISTVAPDSPATGSGSGGNLVVNGGLYFMDAGGSFQNVTIENAGQIVIRNAYDPSTHSGGVMQFSVVGTLSICANCAITVSGKGYPGGSGGIAAAPQGHTAAPGTGPGAGGAGAGSPTLGGGGGGGGHQGPGGSGQAGTQANGGGGGAAYGAADLSDASTPSAAMGSGGGGGGGSALNPGGAGGAGGGFLHVTAGTIVDDGSITAEGQAGTMGAGNAASSGGGGGGGSGGAVWLTATTVQFGGGIQNISVHGLDGGNSWGATGVQPSGGTGGPGYVRIDANTVSGDPGAVYYRTYPGRITAYSYDADERLVDTVSGATKSDGSYWGPTDDASKAGNADPAGGTNVRTRVAYDADGHIVARFGPDAFTGSVTAPNPDYMSRADYDPDGRVTAAYQPRYDSSSAITDLGAGLDPNNTQAAQCRLDNRPQAVLGPTSIPAYPSTTGVCETTATYDAASNRATVTLPTSPGSGSSNRVVTYSYTDDNLVSVVTAPDPSTQNPTVKAASYLYDADGAVMSTTDALNHTEKRAYYDDQTLRQTTGQPGPSATHVTSYLYDANGNTASVTDPVGHVTNSAYYTDNLVSSVTDGAGDVTSYAYDSVGNATAVSSPDANAAASSGNTAGDPTTNSYTYDNLLQDTIVPVVAIKNGAYTGREIFYNYDPAGRKVSAHTYYVDSSGNNTGEGGTESFSYLPDDRLASQTGRSGTPLVSYTYDPAGNPTCVAQDPAAATCTSGQPASDVSASYYLDGLVRAVDDGSAISSPVGHTNSYAYDGAGSRVARTDAIDGTTTVRKTTYAYEDAELAAYEVSDAAGGAKTSFGYDPAGRPTTQADPNGTTATWSFNADNTLGSFALAQGSTTLSSWSYSYNNDYLVTQQAFSGTGAGGATPDTATLAYSYDGANRVQTYSVNGTPTNIGWDADSNRTSYGSQVFKYNADDSIATATDSLGNNPKPFTYDPAGRLTKDACSTYSYDGLDRLTNPVDAGGTGCPASSNVTYTYDGLDRQISSSTGSAAFHYDGLDLTMSDKTLPAGEVVYQLSAAGQPQALTQEGSTPTTQYLGTDGLQSIGTVTSSSGAVVCSLRYDPFGNPVGAPPGQANPCNTGSTLDDYFFQSQRLDQSTGNYQMGARTYDPTKSAFLTPDQSRTTPPTDDPSVGTDPLTRNTFTFVNGDPLNLEDPTGHDAALAAQLAVMSACGSKNTMACSGLSTFSTMELQSLGVPQISRITHRPASQVEQGAYFCQVHRLTAADCAHLLQNGYSQNQRESFKGRLAERSCGVYGQFSWSSGPGEQSCRFETPPREASGDFAALGPIGIMAVAEFVVPEAVGSVGKFIGRFMDRAGPADAGAAGDVAAAPTAPQSAEPAPVTAEPRPVRAAEGGSLSGSGPASGVLEISGQVKSTAAFENLNALTPRNFVFDPASERLVVGQVSKDAGHFGLAQVIGADESTVVGGELARGPRGEFLTSELSGHYGINWTDEVRDQFVNFMSSYGFDIVHTPWTP